MQSLVEELKEKEEALSQLLLLEEKEKTLAKALLQEEAERELQQLKKENEALKLVKEKYKNKEETNNWKHFQDSIRRENLDFKELHLSNQNLCSFSFTSSLSYLEKLNNLTVVNLSQNHLDDSFQNGLKILLNKRLIYLNLSRNHLGINSLNLICSKIEKTSSLKSLEIQGNEFSIISNAGKQISSSLQKNSSIVHLGISLADFNFLEKKETLMNAFEFSQNLRKENSKNSIQSLSLCYAQLSYKTLISIYNYMSNITTLDLSWSYIGIQGVKLLSTSLSINFPSLLSLNITGNKIGTKGCEYLSLALKKNSFLTALNLCKNELDENSCVSLAFGILSNKTLITLDLSRNKLGNKGSQLILNSLEDNNYSIKHLGDLYRKLLYGIKPYDYKAILRNDKLLTRFKPILH